MTLTIRFVGSESEIDDALWQSCFPPPLEGRWWFRALERAGLEDQFTFFYAVVQDNGRDVGISPAFIMNLDIAMVVPEAVLPLIRLGGKILPSLLYQRTLFVGSPCSDEGVVGLLDGVDRRQALEVLHLAFDQEGRRRNASMLVWKDFPAAWDDDFAWLRQNHRLFPVHSFPGTDVCFGGGGRDGYWAGLKGTRRNQMRRKLKKSQSLAPLTIEVVQQPEAPLLAEIFGLFWQTYERSETQFEVLNLAFFQLLAQRPESHFVLLRDPVDGRLVAFMLCFVQGTHVINKFIGLDYARPKEWSLYFRLWDAVVDWAGALGADVIQSGQTGYRAKIEMGHRLIPMSNHARHRNPLIHWLYGKIATGISWATLDKDLNVYLQAHPEDAPPPFA